MLPRALELWSTRLALLVAAAAGIAMSFSPLLGLHGVESAVVLGLLLPPFVAAAAARQVVDARRTSTATGGGGGKGQTGAGAGAVVARALGVALATWAVPTLVLAVNALRFRQCTPGLGFSFIVLGPGIGVTLAAVVGVAVGAAVPRPRLATFLAVLVPIALVALGLWRLWATPAVFSYSHFVGYAPGTLYDEGIRLPPPLVTFRLVTLALGVGIVALTFAGWERTSARLRLGPMLRRPSALAAATLLLAGAGTAEAYGAELGHRTTVDAMAETLGATLRGDRCTVHVPRELAAADARRLLRDCDFRVAQIERHLGVTQRERIRAFFFRDADEKQRLMGAGTTYIAKPWRNEVYLQLYGWPHPVLAHELVHVVAGNSADGPLLVGGGVVPNPGLIEGMAVAAAWDVRDGMTPDEWSAAMLRLGELPALDEVMSLSFGLMPARKAYGASGSFMRFLRESHGAATVRAAYRSGDLEAAAGEPLARLEEQWHAHLRAIPVPDAVLDRARLLLRRDSIFSAVCPHRVADLRRQAEGDVLAGDDGRLRESCGELLDIDPDDVRAREMLVGALARAGDVEQAQAELARLDGAPAVVRDAAREAFADAAWERGETAAALALYVELLGEPRDEDSARELEVKVLALRAGGRQAELLREIFLGPDHLGSPPPVVVHLAGELSAVRPDGLGPYLEARQLVNQSRHGLALPLFRIALARGLPTTRLLWECRRLEAVSLYATGRLDEAAPAFRRIARSDEITEAQRVDALDWLQRIRWTRARATRAPGSPRSAGS